MLNFTTGVLVLTTSLILPTTLFAADTTPLTFSFRSPYDNAGELTITNESARAMTLLALEFDSNAVISGTPYGTLYQYGAELSLTNDADPINNVYTLQESEQGLTIPAHQSVSMVYTFDAVKGPLQVGMNPTFVTATTDNGEYQLNISDACQGAQCQNPVPDYKLMGYFSNWSMYGRNYHASDIPAENLNMLLYAFINYDTAGNVILFDPYADQKQLPTIAQLRQRYPYLITSLSFGGWTLSYNFSALAADAKARQQFAKNAVAAMKEVQFNGIDIDWEFPVANGAPGEPNHATPQDGENFVLLLQAVRAELDKQSTLDNEKYYLSIAVSAGVDKIDAVESANPGAWEKVSGLIDYLNLMTYDMHGGFDIDQPQPYNVSNFMSAMQLDPDNDPTISDPILSQYNANDAVSAYLNYGIKPQQIVLGVPIYGRLATINGAGEKQGLYQPLLGTPPGEHDDYNSGDTGMFDYKCIVRNALCANNGSLLANLQLIATDTSAYGTFSHTPWGYDQHYFLTYDDTGSVAYKSQWIKQQKLGGLMFWELSGDLPVTESDSLVATAHKHLQ